jgi:hypothetical protein
MAVGVDQPEVDVNGVCGELNRAVCGVFLGASLFPTGRPGRPVLLRLVGGTADGPMVRWMR